MLKRQAADGDAVMSEHAGDQLPAVASEEEAIATISISINYVQTAVEGDVVCTTAKPLADRCRSSSS